MHFYSNKKNVKAETSEVLTSHAGSAPSVWMTSRWKTTQQVDFFLWAEHRNLPIHSAPADRWRKGRWAVVSPTEMSSGCFPKEKRFYTRQRDPQQTDEAAAGNRWSGINPPNLATSREDGLNSLKAPHAPHEITNKQENTWQTKIKPKVKIAYKIFNFKSSFRISVKVHPNKSEIIVLFL